MDVTFRPGRLADSPGIFRVFVDAFVDLNRRLNLETAFAQQPFVEWFWQRQSPLFDYLAEDSRFVVAEAEGRVIGYGRSIDRDGTRQLTEFFVDPASQSAGLGRELLAQVFPDDDRADGIERKFILATLDTRAQVRYLKSGVYPRFPIQYFSRVPEAFSFENHLDFEPAQDTPEIRAALNEIDRAVLGFSRPEEHAFLLADRAGFLVRRGGALTGYAYLGKETGPIALLDPADFPAVLAYAENAAAARGDRNLGMEVPMINQAAVDHLLQRGFRIDPFTALFMSNEPFGHFDRYINTSPPLFI